MQKRYSKEENWQLLTMLRGNASNSELAGFARSMDRNNAEQGNTRYSAAVAMLESLGVPEGKLGNVKPSVENMVGVYIYLGLKDMEFVELVRRFPQIVGYSEDNLGRKISWYDIYLDIEKAELLSKDASVLSCSIYRRVMPRAKYAAGLGFEVKKENIRQLLFPADGGFIRFL